MRWAIPVMFIGTLVIGLADQEELPAGTGKEVVRKTCTKCHAATEFNGRKFSKTRWTNVVDDMMSRGAEASEEEITAIVTYLTRNFGKPLNVNTSTEQQFEEGLAISAELAKQVVLYRSDHGTFKTVEDLAKVPGIDAALIDEQRKNLVF